MGWISVKTKVERSRVDVCEKRRKKRREEGLFIEVG